MKSLLDSLVVDNPMKIEIARFRRRFLGFGGSGVNNAVLVLILLCYTGMVMLVVNTRGDLAPIWLLMFQTGLFCFFGPAMLHGSIAGERERRSWDLLLVAPITKAQIVAGKYMGAMAALGIGAAAMAIPTVLASAAYGKTSIYDLVLAEAVSLSFCMLVCAWTIFISARVKRPFMALGATLGTLCLGLIVLPALFSSLAMGDRFSTEMFAYLNPFSALAFLTMAENASADSMSGTMSHFIPLALYGIPHVLIYLGLSAGFLVYAEKTLHFPENEVKFIPQNHDA
jgi:ABC-type transport system involved in multi-copper enzyme maturation permease subunit